MDEVAALRKEIPAGECGGYIHALEAELLAARGAMAAQDARNLAATERLGLAPRGCDTPDALADEVEGLRAAACRMRETISSISRITISRIVDNPGPADNHALCQINKIVGANIAALSASGPCLHAAKLAAARRLCGEFLVELTDNRNMCDCGNPDLHDHKDLMDLLRAFAKGGKW